MSEAKKYDRSYKEQSVKPALEIGVKQSMNSVGGRCHENARCESMWARMKNELFGMISCGFNLHKLHLKRMAFRSAA